MAQLLKRAPESERSSDEPLKVLDVGSRDVNGTYRAMIVERGWQYTGLDIEAGGNVDVVSADPYGYPFPDGAFDLVISGQTMEHVEDLRAWVIELARVLKPGGRLCIVTVWAMFLHDYPGDCWRIMPDGMQWLFNQTGVLTDYDIRRVSDNGISGDIVGAATKKEV
jgi:SAM-dependent methyltransferase